MQNKNINSSIENIEKNMRIYGLLHKLDVHHNFNDKNAHNMALYINDNPHLFYENDNNNEIRSLASKCLTIDECKNILLNYELTYYHNNDDKEMTYDDFVKEVSKILKKYQWKAGGFLIEDKKWKKEIESNGTILFVNTISEVDIESIETKNYLNKIIKRLNNTSKNMEVDLQFKKNKKDKIFYIIIKIINKKVEPDIIIGL
jgi:hypothetical protein